MFGTYVIVKIYISIGIPNLYTAATAV